MPGTVNLKFLIDRKELGPMSGRVLCTCCWIKHRFELVVQRFSFFVIISFPITFNGATLTHLFLAFHHVP